MMTKWVEGAYGFWFLRLPGGFTVTVGWDSTRPKDSKDPSGYKVSFEDSALAKRYTSLADAKAASAAFAKHKLETALAALGD